MLRDRSTHASSATILLVDDDIGVLKVIVRMLRAEGHEVIACTSFEEAQAQLARGIKPDLLITDVVLNTSTGKKVAAAVKQAAPNTKVIFISGYGNVVVGGCPVLGKPFSREELMDLVDAALGPARTSIIPESKERPSRKKH